MWVPAFAGTSGMKCLARAGASPAFPARCAITASRSALPKRDALALLARRPQSVLRRSSRPFDRCSVRRIRIGNALTRYSTPFGAATACVSDKSSRASRERAMHRRGGSPKRTCRRKRSAFPIASSGAATATATLPPTAAAAAKARRAPKHCRQPICVTSSIPTISRRRMRWRRGLPAPCARGSFAASRCAVAAAGSICAAPSTATFRTAER